MLKFFVMRCRNRFAPPPSFAGGEALLAHPFTVSDSGLCLSASQRS